jgi:drug/metabolite transporter (DMT)-like permease
VTSAKETRRAWLAWFAICLIWGTTYLAIKIGLNTIPPLLLGGFRYLLAAVIMIAGMKLRGRPLPPRSTWPMQAALGFCMIALGNGGVVTGEGYLTSGLTAVLVATSPFWMVGIDAMFPGGVRPRPRQLLGMGVGFAGIIMLVWPDIAIGGAGRRNVILGVIAVQVACLGWSFASSYTKRHALSGDVLGAAMLQMLFGGIFMTAGATIHGEWARLSFTTPTSLALLYLTLLGSVVAFVAYSYALKHLPIAVVSLYTYVNPIIAVALGIVLLNEPFDLRQVAAAVVIGLGMLIVRPAKSVDGEVS